jgi:hypothetical protein
MNKLSAIVNDTSPKQKKESRPPSRKYPEIKKFTLLNRNVKELIEENRKSIKNLERFKRKCYKLNKNEFESSTFSSNEQRLPTID